ncbi:hypothetical protein B0H14DRAFT_2628010 [Mycena olivaceomarginata]|nr:hypothetical protein B0H14DRAFT_2628010 [Mycena olivaceomarginata]
MSEADGEDTQMTSLPQDGAPNDGVPPPPPQQQQQQDAGQQPGAMQQPALRPPPNTGQFSPVIPQQNLIANPFMAGYAQPQVNGQPPSPTPNPAAAPKKSTHIVMGGARQERRAPTAPDKTPPSPPPPAEPKPRRQRRQPAPPAEPALVPAAEPAPVPTAEPAPIPGPYHVYPNAVGNRDGNAMGLILLQYYCENSQKHTATRLPPSTAHQYSVLWAPM